MLRKESLTAVTSCGQCGAEMSTVAVCDQCDKRMCMKCGTKHACKDKKERGRGEFHPQHPADQRGDRGGR